MNERRKKKCVKVAEHVIWIIFTCNKGVEHFNLYDFGGHMWLQELMIKQGRNTSIIFIDYVKKHSFAKKKKIMSFAELAHIDIERMIYFSTVVIFFCYVGHCMIIKEFFKNIEWVEIRFHNLLRDLRFLFDDDDDVEVRW